MNWFSDDGINLPMINDHIRNKFYYEMLKDVVPGKECIDIGFGTGLLSVIALQHGASHVLAYEKDPARFQLGKQIIEECKLENQITLVNQDYKYLPGDQNSVIFSEIISCNLWSEGLWDCLPKHASNNFYPSRYKVNLLAMPMDLANLSAYTVTPFSPGIEIKSEFIEAVNNKIKPWLSSSKENNFNDYLNQNRELLFLRALLQDTSSKFLGSYEVNVKEGNLKYFDANNLYQQCPLSETEEFAVINIDVPPPSLIFATVEFGCSKKLLPLYQTISWAPVPDLPYVNFDHVELTFNHNFRNGEIQFFKR